jgi:hypothetical protein
MMTYRDAGAPKTRPAAATFGNGERPPMRRCFRPSSLVARLLAGALIAGGALVGEGRASAAVAWGDASLSRDDAMVEIGREGVATVTHVLSLRVSGKKFRAFVIDGVDDGAEAPEGPEAASGRDGPGWLVDIEGSKGEKLSGLVEPTKETRKLRVRLGDAGLARGDWTVRLRYRVDFAKQHLFARDDSTVHFSWQGPHWPDGFDGGKVTFVLPAGVVEPRVGLADPAGGELGTQAVEGVALVALQRSPELDRLEITRPHVAHGDDSTWIVHLDPRAMPTVSAHLPRPERDTFRVGEEAQGIRAHLKWVLATPGLAVLLGLALALRDRGARRAARARGTELRPLVPLSAAARAIGYGLTFAGACVATTAGQLYVAAGLLAGAIALATARPPLPASARRPRGRWLAIPASAIPAPRRPPGSWLDPETPSGAFLAVAGIAAVACGAVFVARTHLELAIVGVIHALALVPLMATGRASQLPPSLARDAWPLLAPVGAAIGAIPDVQTRPIARLVAAQSAGANDGARSSEDAADAADAADADAGVDEVRLRVDVAESARARGVVQIEVGCALVQGTGSATLVPELLVRLRVGSDAAARFDHVLAAVPASATLASLPGRTADERVVAIRPAITSPVALRRWVEWTLATVGDAPAVPASRTPERALFAAAAAL